jgi:uncharacterized membrane protein YgcG
VERAIDCIGEEAHTVDALVAALDPHSELAMRATAARDVAFVRRALATVAASLPAVDVCATRNLAAVAPRDGSIVIYDLRTACKWRVLSGFHTREAPPTAIRFDEPGNRIVSYSPFSGRLAVWRVDSSSVSGTASYLWNRLTGRGSSSSAAAGGGGGGAGGGGGNNAAVRSGAAPVFVAEAITPPRPNLGPNAIVACGVHWHSPRQVAASNGVDEGVADAGSG